MKSHKSEMQKKIFLLTDGEVHNTRQIVKLVESNAYEMDCRVHTFGIGRGASQELIREVAFAGLGTFSFVQDLTKIEETVINALMKNYAPILKIVKIKAECVGGEEIDFLTDPEFSGYLKGQLNLRNAVEFNVAILSKRLNSLKNLTMEIINPNTN